MRLEIHTTGGKAMTSEIKDCIKCGEDCTETYGYIEDTGPYCGTCHYLRVAALEKQYKIMRGVPTFRVPQFKKLRRWLAHQWARIYVKSHRCRAYSQGRRRHWCKLMDMNVGAGTCLRLRRASRCPYCSLLDRGEKFGKTKGRGRQGPRRH